MRLSIAMIVKNEEKNLDRTLRALEEVRKEIETEIVIVDTGSEDRTKEIAKKYTENVYEHEWTGNFAEMRNISFGYCTGEWILVLDADEVLENPEELIAFFNTNKCEQFNSAVVRIINTDESSKKTFNEASLYRLFRNLEGFRYKGRVHEQPVKFPPTAMTNIRFKHYGYSADDYELMIYKFKRNTELLKEELNLRAENEEEQIYILFQLSKSYAMAKKDDIAFEYIKKAYELDLKYKKKNKGIRTYVYYWYACSLFNKGNFEKVIKICKEILNYSEDNLDVYFMLAVSYTRLEKYKYAYEYYDKFFEIKKLRDKGVLSADISMVETLGANVNKARSNKVLCYYKERRYADVVREVEKDEDILSGWKDVVRMYIFSCTAINRMDKIVDFYEQKELEDIVLDKLIIDWFKTDYDNVPFDIDEVKKTFSALDQRVKIYIDVINNDILKDMSIIDFSQCYTWKIEILERAILKDTKNLDLIKDLNNDIIKLYIDGLCNNYECVELIYNYCKENFLVTDVSRSNFICDIENVLLFNKSIKGDKYKELIVRTLVNKKQLRNKVFNISLLKKHELECVLSKYDRFLLAIENEIKSYSLGKVPYLKRLKSILKTNKEYTSVINVLLKEVSDEAISKDMVEEKCRVLQEVESCICNNKVNEAEEVLNELDKIFKWEKDIFNYRGVINYINGNYEKSLYNLSVAMMLIDGDYEPIFNIACVLENMNRIEDSIEYYKNALKVCGDEQAKQQINEAINRLN